MSWFSARCILVGNSVPLVIERMTLWQCDSFTEALHLAEGEVQRHAAERDLRYAGFSDIYHAAGIDVFGDERPVSGDEVFSLLRDSDRDGRSYVARFFDTTAAEEEHRAGEERPVPGEPCWFASRGVVQWTDVQSFEERVTIWHAASSEEAAELSGRDRESYAASLPHGLDLGVSHLHCLGTEPPGHGAEIFVWPRGHASDIDSFIKTFFDSGAERANPIE